MEAPVVCFPHASSVHGAARAVRSRARLLAEKDINITLLRAANDDVKRQKEDSSSPLINDAVWSSKRS
jgi:hypothetical protein